MKMNKLAIEGNNLDQDIAGPSGQLNFSSNPNYGRLSKRALTMNIQVDNIGLVIVEEEKKARKRYRMYKNNAIYMCLKCLVHLYVNYFEKVHTK